LEYNLKESSRGLFNLSPMRLFEILNKTRKKISNYGQCPGEESKEIFRKKSTFFFLFGT